MGGIAVVTEMPDSAVRRVAIGGLGTIGLAVAQALDDGIEGLVLTAVSARDHEKAMRRMAGFQKPASILGLEALAEAADIIVECAPVEVFRDVAEPAIEQGRVLIPLSCGQLLDHMDLVERAKETGARIVVPTGALLGLDAVRGAAESTIHEVRITTRKPPSGLAGAPWLEENGISLEGLQEARLLFEGSAREAIAAFPANVNVAVALSLAGIGPDQTRIEIWADPEVTRNTHLITVEADTVRFSMTIENVPSEENPRTGRLTAPSTIAALRGLVSTLKVGS